MVAGRRDATWHIAKKTKFWKYWPLQAVAFFFVALCGLAFRPDPSMWKLTFTPKGREKFVQCGWLRELACTDVADPAQRWARLYVPLQFGEIVETGEVLYTFEQMS